METAYLDESYTADFFYVGAATAPPDAWQRVAEDLNVFRIGLQEMYDLPEDIEFHATDIFGGRKDWSSFRGKHGEAAGVVSAVLKIANARGVRYTVRGVDIKRLDARYGAGTRIPHVECLEHTLQRLDKHGEYHQMAKGSIALVADEVDLSNELQHQFAGYQQFGTRGYFPRDLSYLQPEIDFRDSKTEAGLQVADVMVYMYRRRYAHTETNPAAAKAVDKIMKVIYRRIINGHGCWTP
ncbi:DUF3800 domain-containing protein [uncultured Micrococcus sp.]|uniref:DUF3800 domain-containing protein n=1 Tax=uncultured Micrococcus sp. TaxID=114051 RepID=UPI00260C2205|nr:DUF3800 domain-containing protein [uncultured Micrococcus sp.]